MSHRGILFFSSTPPSSEFVVGPTIGIANALMYALTAFVNLLLYSEIFPHHLSLARNFNLENIFPEKSADPYFFLILLSHNARGEGEKGEKNITLSFSASIFVINLPPAILIGAIRLTKCNFTVVCGRIFIRLSTFADATNLLVLSPATFTGRFVAKQPLRDFEA